MCVIDDGDGDGDNDGDNNGDGDNDGDARFRIKLAVKVFSKMVWRIKCPLKVTGADTMEVE